MRKIEHKLWYLITHLCFKRNFKGIGKNSFIYKPLQIDYANSILIEENVSIYHYAWLMGNANENQTLQIKKNTIIGHFSHIVATKSVIIGEAVLMADRIFISDCTHNFNNINLPIKNQKISFLNPVVIGDGAWIGENVCVLGASIGKQSIIGSNSVVTSNIPDYCVAVGAPAKVIKRYDFSKDEWTSVH